MKSQRRLLVFLVCFIVILAAAPAEAPAPPGKRPRAESRAKQKQQPKSRAKVKKKPAKPASSASWLKKFAARFRRAPGSRSGQASVAAKPPNTSLEAVNPHKICGKNHPADSITRLNDSRQPKSLEEIRQRKAANGVRRYSVLDHITAGQQHKVTRKQEMKVARDRSWSMNSVHPEVQPVLHTFKDGIVTPRILTKDETFYRYHGRPVVGKGNVSQKEGDFFTKILYKTPKDTAVKLGLNTLPTKWTEVTVKKGTLVYEGTAATFTPGIGGGHQAFIPRLKPGNPQKKPKPEEVKVEYKTPNNFNP